MNNTTLNKSLKVSNSGIRRACGGRSVTNPQGFFVMTLKLLRLCRRNRWFRRWHNSYILSH